MAETPPRKSKAVVTEEDYKLWTHTQLLDRVVELEKNLKIQTEKLDRNLKWMAISDMTGPVVARPGAPYSQDKVPKVFEHDDGFDPSRYNTRLIALKFAYLGEKYNGFEHHAGNKTPLPTVEEVVWKALMKTKLIFPRPRAKERCPSPIRINRRRHIEPVDVNWDGCDYTKCGRTDKGVNAFGQVIGLRVRSKRPLRKKKVVQKDAVEPALRVDQNETLASQEEAKLIEDQWEPEPPFDPVEDEISYVQILNQVLPPDIRMIAWCPNPPPDFSARFSCRERRYKYFFTQPAYAPMPGESATSSSPREGYLSIPAMREAARHIVGLHDFRNMCKIDPSKQITNWKRRIFHADIEDLGPLTSPSYFQDYIAGAEPPRLYAFVVHGSAFLWHQVRHMASLLFLVGQGLESPGLIPDLLDVANNPTKPIYEMADGTPLVLWDCIFPAQTDTEAESGLREFVERSQPDSLEWIHIGHPTTIDSNDARGRWGSGGLVYDIWTFWSKIKMDEILAAQLLDKVATTGASALVAVDGDKKGRKGVRVYDGGNSGKKIGSYTPVMKKERIEPVEILNARYLERRIREGKRVYGRPIEGPVNDSEPVDSETPE